MLKCIVACLECSFWWRDPECKRGAEEKAPEKIDRFSQVIFYDRPRKFYKILSRTAIFFFIF